MGDTVLHQFNDTVRLFVADLKNIFGEGDSDILRIELLLDMLKVNARIVIRPFQNTICNNPVFVQHILQEDRDFFLQFQFEQLTALNESEYYMHLLHKFREALSCGINKKTQTAIFNWFKIMIYHAYRDDGKDADSIMKDLASHTTSSSLHRDEGSS